MAAKERILKIRVLEFIRTWREVIIIKQEEISGFDEGRKKALQKFNKSKADNEPQTAFGYIYNWITLTPDGKVEPHTAKTRFDDYSSKTKQRYNEYPVAADITDYICEIRSGNYKSSSASIDSSVRRTLSQLIKDKKIKKEGLSYYPVLEDELKSEKTLSDMGPLNRDCFLEISHNTYVISYNVETVSDDILNFYRNFFDKNVFAIYSHKNLIYIHLNGDYDNCRKMGSNLHQVVNSAYLIQDKRRNIKNKITRQNYKRNQKIIKQVLTTQLEIQERVARSINASEEAIKKALKKETD